MIVNLNFSLPFDTFKDIKYPLVRPTETFEEDFILPVNKIRAPPDLVLTRERSDTQVRISNKKFKFSA